MVEKAVVLDAQAQLPGVVWRKSSRSGQLGNCVEVASLESGQTAVRDSKNPAGPALIYTSAEWAAFTAGVNDGEFS